MTPHGAGRDEEIRGLLINALEVQLAAFQAGIRFWEDWIGEASKFVTIATENLHAIDNEREAPKEALLEVVDAGRASIRSMMELPGTSASRFVQELEKIAKRPRAAAPAAKPASGGKKKRGPRKRAARVKN